MTISTRRQRHQTRFRRARVVSNTRITPHMARLVLHSPDFEGFQSLGFDDHIRLFFPAPGTSLAQPEPGERGLIWPGEKPEMRDYTPRFFDPEALCMTIDFVIHDAGVASVWAENAREGDELGIGGPRGSFIIEGEIDWHLLIGDLSSLPAIGRRIEELPAGSHIRAIIEVPNSTDEQHFECASTPEVVWVHMESGDTLLKHIKILTLPPNGDGFIFVAGEASMIAQAKDKISSLGHPEKHLKAANYWRIGGRDTHDH